MIRLITTATLICLVSADLVDELLISDAEKQHTRGLAIGCNRETGVDADFLNKVETGVISSYQNNCFFKCYFMKFGTMLENGDYNVPLIKKVLHEKYHKFIEECTGLRGADLCETSFKGYTCLLEKVRNFRLKNHTL